MPEHESLGPLPSGDPARPHRPPLVSGGFFVFLLVWPILWCNAKIVDASDPGRWVSLPTTVRFVEPAVILGVIALAYLFGRPSRDHFTTSILRWLGILGVAGIVGSILAPPGLLNMLYGIYDVMVAFVLLVAALVVGFDRTELMKLTRYLVLLCLLNWIVGVVQAVVLGVEADLIHGLFNDANTMSTVFYVLSGYCLYRYALSRSLPHLFYGLFLLPIAYLGFNEKLNLFFLGCMMPLVFLRLRKRLLPVILAGVTGVLLIVATVDFAASRGLSGRTSQVSDLTAQRGGLVALGVIRSWPLAWEQIKDQPLELLFGSGASNYGGPVAAGRFNNGTATTITNEIFEFQTGREYLGAFDSPTNYFSNVLAEFGLVGFLAALALLGRIVWTLHRLGAWHSDPDLVAWAWAAKWGWIVVAMQAVFVPFGAFGNLAVMTPIVLATAVVVSEGSRRPHMLPAPVYAAARR